MVLECLTWIPHLLCSPISSFLSRKRGFGPFPDDILINILSRLPVESLLKFRRVCKHWRALTSSNHFFTLQNERASTGILVQCVNDLFGRDPELIFYIFDQNTRQLRKIGLMSEFRMKRHNPTVIFSCVDLLLFRSGPHVIALNLITREEKFLECSRVHVCGLFFYLLAREYRYLCAYKGSNSYEYYLNSFVSPERSKLVSDCFSFKPRGGTTPVILNHALHWIVDHTSIMINGINPCMHAVMVFRTDSEELSTLPHPGTSCKCSHSHGLMHLFDKDKNLSLCHLQPHQEIVNIWILEDYANWHWVRRYRMKVTWDEIGIMGRLSTRIDARILYHGIKVISVGRDELFINWFSRGLYMLYLTRNTYTFRKIDVPLRSRDGSCYCVAYTNSPMTRGFYSPNSIGWYY